MFTCLFNFGFKSESAELLKNHLSDQVQVKLEQSLALSVRC